MSNRILNHTAWGWALGLLLFGASVAQGAQLKARWTFDADFSDSVGGHTADINSGTPAIVHTGQHVGNGCLSLDGASSLKVVSNADLESDSFTMMYWFKAPADLTGAFNRITGYTDFAFDTDFSVDNIRSIWCYASSFGDWLKGTYPIAPLDKWINVAYIYDDSTHVMTLYVNGTVATSSDAKDLVRTGKDFFIGSNCYAGQNFRGLVDDLRLYDGVLSAEQVRGEMITKYAGSSEILHLTFDTDLSAAVGQVTAEKHGNVVIDTDSPRVGQGCLKLGGAEGADYVKLNTGSVLECGPYTLSYSVKSADTQDPNWNRITGLDAYWCETDFYVSDTGTDSLWVGDLIQGGPNYTTMTRNEWTHMAFVYNGNATDNFVVYKDGNKVATLTMISPGLFGRNLFIGGSCNGSQNFTGWLDDLRIFNYAMDETQVGELAASVPVELSSFTVE